MRRGSPAAAIIGGFRLRTVAGPDDYASMREVLTRRFTHGMKSGAEPAEEPGGGVWQALPASRI